MIMIGNVLSYLVGLEPYADWARTAGEEGKHLLDELRQKGVFRSTRWKGRLALVLNLTARIRKFVVGEDASSLFTILSYG
jgi:hypothetical protein